MSVTKGQRPPNILIVDDTPGDSLLLVRMLTERGFRARPALSGRLALEEARSEAPDVILLDITMPEMNGYEVCAQLKADAVLRTIPVIFISALDDMMDKVKAFNAGGADYVTKPFRLGEVNLRIDTQLHLRSQETLRGNLGRMNVHDLRSPLAVLCGLQEILELHEAGGLPAGGDDLVTAARRSAKDLLDSLSSLLADGETGAGVIRLRHEACDLEALLRTVLDTSQPLPGNRTVTLDSPELAGALAADSGLLRRVLRLLLCNALEHTPAGGDVRISLTPSRSEVRVAFRDAGPGIAPEDRDRIFSRAGQVDGGASGSGGDSGLTFCKLAVEAHGGRIGVDSEAGQGRTFWLVLPRVLGGLPGPEEGSVTAQG